MVLTLIFRPGRWLLGRLRISMQMAAVAGVAMLALLAMAVLADANAPASLL